MDRPHAGLVRDKTTAELKRELAQAGRAGAKSVDILGGEPTIRRDITEVIAFARKTGFKRVLFTTNGRMLSYEPVARGIVESGVSEIRFSIHGHNAKLHDSLTGMQGSFVQLAAGVKNLQTLGFGNLSANTTIVRANYRHLPGITKFISSLGIPRANLIYAYAGSKDYAEIVPKVSEAAPYIRKCLVDRRPPGRGFPSGSSGLEVRLINVPLPCLFMDLNGYLCDYQKREDEYFRPSRPGPYEKFESEKRWKKIKLPVCSSCAVRKKCSGVCADYVRTFGGGEVKPV